MKRREAPHCQDALIWLTNRGWDLAPLTGQDRPALLAVAHCWQLWTTGDEDGRLAAVDAVAALLGACQEVVWPMARELVAQAADWDHRAAVWPKVVWRFEENVRLRLGSMAAARDYERSKRLECCHEGLAQVHP